VPFFFVSILTQCADFLLCVNFQTVILAQARTHTTFSQALLLQEKANMASELQAMEDQAQAATHQEDAE
jgi:hypothetical protein